MSLRKLVIVIFAFSVSGCAAIEPLVQDFNIISVPQEIELGKQVQQQMTTEKTLVNDPALLNRIRGVGQRLVATLPRKDFDYQFFIVKDDTPNAFTIPGGTIYVHTGLLNFVENDDELAGVMAHELGHAYDRHPAKGVSRQMGVDEISKLFFKGNEKSMQATALQIAKTGLLNRYGRQDEYRADEIGYYILTHTSYRPQGLREFFVKLQTLTAEGTSVPFLSTHPPTPDRIARLKALESGQLKPQAQWDITTTPTQNQFVSRT